MEDAAPMTEKTVSEPSGLSVSYQDDPHVIGRLRRDDFSTHVVPDSGRVPRWQLTMSAWSLLSAMVWLFYGALVGELYGTGQALIGIAVSVVLYSVVTPLFTRWSLVNGLNSTLLSRRMFGVVGSSLTALLVAVTVTYYAVFESSTLAVALQSYTGHLNIKVWYAIVVIAMLPLMLSGVQTWMAKLNGYLLPLYIIGLVAAVIAAAVKNGAGSHWTSFAGIVPPVARVFPGWVLVVLLYLGLTIMMPTAADFGRFGKRADRRFHENVTFGAPFYVWLYGLNGVAGIFLTQTMLKSPSTVEAGVVEAILACMGFWGLLLIVVTQTRINSLNYYLSSANWERLVSGLTGFRIPRVIWVGIVSAAVFLLMLTDVFSYLQTALSWQGVFLIGWVGIVCTHMLLVRGDRKALEFRASRLPKVTPGLAVWVLSAAVGIFLVQDHSLPARLSSLAPVIVLALSVVLYAAVLLLLPAPRRNPHADPRDEVTDSWAARVVCTSCDSGYVAVEMDRHPGSGAVVCDECVTTRRANA
jgi:purine-cytosine permease-like protein